MNPTKKSGLTTFLAAAALSASFMAPPPAQPAQPARVTDAQIAHTTSQQSQERVAQRAAASNTYTYSNFVDADPFNLGRSSGMTPKEWGMSEECRKMVRHGRMTRKGVGAARI